jgi:Fe-S-cluster containining protein
MRRQEDQAVASVMGKALTGEQRAALEAIYEQIDERVHPIVGGHDWWPCRKGCDLCCRTLADLPVLTETEWEYLWEGFERLDPEVQAQVRARVARLAEEEAAGKSRRYYTCPLLDLESGACLVYHNRPAVCRTYGFYVTHSQGNWCDQIEELLKEHGDADIVWGNQVGIDRQLDTLATPMIGLLDWFAEHPAGDECKE